MILSHFIVFHPIFVFLYRSEARKINPQFHTIGIEYEAKDHVNCLMDLLSVHAGQPKPCRMGKVGYMTHVIGKPGRGQHSKNMTLMLLLLYVKLFISFHFILFEFICIYIAKCHG